VNQQKLNLKSLFSVCVDKTIANSLLTFH